jgi:hypothetical protein
MTRGFKHCLLTGGRFKYLESVTEGIECGVEQAQDIALVVHEKDMRR